VTEPLLNHTYAFNDGRRAVAVDYATYNAAVIVLLKYDDAPGIQGMSMAEFRHSATHLAPPTRKAWVDYFMAIVRETSSRSTCDRKHVGAILVHDSRIIATGYNGSAPGAPHCDDVGHDIGVLDGRETCLRTIHAEQNSVLQAGLYGVSSKDSVCYTNTYPCWNCAKVLLAARVKRVVYDADYFNDPRVSGAFSAASVELVRYQART